LNKGHYAYILTVDEKYWSRLRQRGEELHSSHVFVRKNQVAPKQVDKLLFYITRKKQIQGTADFVERLTGNYDDLWEKFGDETYFESFDEYKKFTDGRRKVTFIRFRNLTQIIDPKPTEELVKVVGTLDRFGLGQYVDAETVMELV